MITSYHNHTDWSDGKHPLEAFILEAQRQGVDELGISDHFGLHPREARLSWCMTRERLPEYVQTLALMASRQQRLKIRTGLEVDYFPATAEALKHLLAPYDFDFLIGSVHLIDDFQLDETEEKWKQLSESERNQIWKKYWAEVRIMASSRIFDIVAHVDLPKRFGFRPTMGLAEDMALALDAIADSGMALEINTSGWFFPAQEAYPSPEILKAARDREIPILINADAHDPAYLTRGFADARTLARNTGYTHTVAFEKRRAIPIPLNPADAGG